MPEIVVAAEGRTENGKNANRRLRSRGLIPGVVYGSKKEAVHVAVSPKEIGAILRSASGENTLFDLVWQAGEQFGIRPFGIKAMLALAVEKSYRLVGRELSIEYAAFESGLDRFVHLMLRRLQQKLRARTSGKQPPPDKAA